MLEGLVVSLTPLLSSGPRRTFVDFITESLLSSFVQQHRRDGLPPDRQFEHFAAYVTISQLYKDTFDTADVVTGGGNDTGIDAIALLVNGRLVADVDELDDATASGAATLDVSIVLVQAERSSNFDGAKITIFGQGAIDLFSAEHRLPRNAQVEQAASVIRAIYNRASKFVRGRPACHLFYVTTGSWQNDQILEARRKVVCDDLTNLNRISRIFEFAKKQAAPSIKGVSQAFVGFVSARKFKSLITDDAGELIRGIFYDNVRDWQGTNHVNNAMEATLKSDFRDRFLLMNNGVTVVARSLQQVGDMVTVVDFQIVNGCQTSHVMFNSLSGSGLDEVMIPLRLIATDSEEVISSIIEATNRQTAIPELQFLAMTDFQKKLETFFAGFGEDKKLYYERRAKQYESLESADR